MAQILLARVCSWVRVNATDVELKTCTCILTSSWGKLYGNWISKDLFLCWMKNDQDILEFSTHELMEVQVAHACHLSIFFIVHSPKQSSVWGVALRHQVVMIVEIHCPLETLPFHMFWCPNEVQGFQGRPCQTCSMQFIVHVRQVPWRTHQPTSTILMAKPRKAWLGLSDESLRGQNFSI